MIIHVCPSIQVFRAHSTKQRLLQDFGDEMITVATANTHSYRKGDCCMSVILELCSKCSAVPMHIHVCVCCLNDVAVCFTVKMTFCEYVERYMRPQTLETLGNGNQVYPQRVYKYI